MDLDKQKITPSEISKISAETQERAEIAKKYIENKYRKMIDEEKAKKEWWEKMIKNLESYNLSPNEQKVIKRDYETKEAVLFRKMRKKITAQDFEPLKIIGRGAFGEVRLCRFKDSGKLCAVKKMKKSEMVFKNQIAHVRAERNILVEAQTDWVVD